MKKLLLTAIALAMFSFLTGCFLEEVVPTGELRFYNNNGYDMAGASVGDYKEEPLYTGYTSYHELDEGTYDIEYIADDGGAGYWATIDSVTLYEDGKGTIEFYLSGGYQCVSIIDESYKSSEGEASAKVVLTTSDGKTYTAADGPIQLGKAAKKM